MSATVPTINELRPRWNNVSGPIDLTTNGGVINTGDMVYWTATGTPGFAAMQAAADTAFFVGVSRDTYPMAAGAGLVETGQANAVSFSPSFPITLLVEGDFSFKTTPGQTFEPFAAVYMGADCQTVSTTASGTAIGTVAPDQRPVGHWLGAAVVGAVGVNVAVRINPALR